MSTGLQALIPKSGDELNVVAIGRISTIHQDAENIEASYRYIRDFLDRIYHGPLKITLLGEQASGMLTDRTTIRQAEEQVASGAVDLVIAEDLARIYRNPRYQFSFVQNAVDMGTRVICIGDNLDTADENWEITMGAAALRHGLHIPDTRRRVRRTATHSFHKGGMVQKVRYGYRKLTKEEAASGHFGLKELRIAKRPECTPVIRSMMDRVLRGESYAAVADWVNSAGHEPGPYVKTGRWTARLVVELLDNPILSGLRTFRDTICRPIFKTGRHKPMKNAVPEIKHYSELAHLSPEEHSTLRQAIARRRADHARAASGPPIRRGVPRSRSLWPGQSVTCAICGSLLYYAGSHLRCSHVLARHGTRCWNHVQVPAQLVRERVVTCLMAELERTGFCQAMVEIAWKMLEGNSNGRTRHRRNLAQDVAGLERQAANLSTAIAEGGLLATLVQKLKEVERALKVARAAQAAEVEQSDKAGDQLSKQQVASRLPETLLALASTSFEFADLLRRIIPEFVIQPVQALDTPLVRPRGKLRFRLDRLVSKVGSTSGSAVTPTECSLVIDLFEPPAHIRAVPACLAARVEHPHLSLKRIGAFLGLNHMTVKRALDYSRRMERMGAIEPYRELLERPPQVSRWHRRQRFNEQGELAEVNGNKADP